MTTRRVNPNSSLHPVKFWHVYLSWVGYNCIWGPTEDTGSVNKISEYITFKSMVQICSVSSSVVSVAGRSFFWSKATESVFHLLCLFWSSYQKGTVNAKMFIQTFLLLLLLALYYTMYKLVRYNLIKFFNPYCT